MAEAFGLAAGVIGVASLALQLADSINKLRELREKVKTLPSELEDTIEELDTLGGLLTQLPGELDLSGHSANSTARKYVTLCCRGVDQIRKAATALQTQALPKRYRNAIRNASEDGKLQMQLQKLERGKSTLMLAFQMYMAMSQRDYMHELLASQAALGQQVQTALTSNPPKPCSTPSRKGAVTREKTSAVFVYQTSRWLSSTVWQLCVRRAATGWDFKLRAYKTLADDHPVWDLCSSGDTVGIRDLLSTGQISLYDRNPRGENLFYVRKWVKSREPIADARYSQPYTTSKQSWLDSSIVTVSMPPQLITAEYVFTETAPLSA